MSDKKQSSVDFIFNAFNILSDSDFKAWMLNNHCVIKAMHKEEILGSWGNGWVNGDVDVNRYEDTAEEFYKETFGGNNE